MTPIKKKTGVPIPSITPLNTRKKTKKTSEWDNPPPAPVLGDRFNILVKEDEIKNIYDNIKFYEN